MTTALLVNFHMYCDIAETLKLRATNVFRLSDRHRLIFAFDGRTRCARVCTASAALLYEDTRGKIENGRVSFVLWHNTNDLINRLTCCLFHCLFRSSSYTTHSHTQRKRTMDNAKLAVEVFLEQGVRRRELYNILASNSVVDWFGRTIKGRQNIVNFFLNSNVIYEHSFSSVETTQAFEDRKSHMTT